MFCYLSDLWVSNYDEKINLQYKKTGLLHEKAGKCI